MAEIDFDIISVCAKGDHITILSTPDFGDPIERSYHISELQEPPTEEELVDALSVIHKMIFKDKNGQSGKGALTKKRIAFNTIDRR